MARDNNASDFFDGVVMQDKDGKIIHVGDGINMDKMVLTDAKGNLIHVGKDATEEEIDDVRKFDPTIEDLGTATGELWDKL